VGKGEAGGGMGGASGMRTERQIPGYAYGGRMTDRQPMASLSQTEVKLTTIK